MQKHLSSHRNHTPVSHGMQLLLPLDVGIHISSDDPVRLIDAFVDTLTLEEVYGTAVPQGRKATYPEHLLLKLCLMAATMARNSSRSTEDLCLHDIRFLWLLQGRKAPDHTTLWRFKTWIAPRLPGILMRFNQLLYAKGVIDDAQVFIDGTKLEAASGRYTFVWKKAVLGHLRRWLEKLPIVVSQSHEALGKGDIALEMEQPQETLRALLEYVDLQMQTQGIRSVQGKGKHKHALQKVRETLCDSLEKYTRYQAQLALCGEDRSSFSKTDPDATFMRMKDDHMRNGQLKPCYNLQLAVNSEFILAVDVSQDRADYHRLPTVLAQVKEVFSHPVKAVCADAGYDCEENHLYCAQEGIKAYIKPQNYEQKKQRSTKTNPKYRESMHYDEATDTYTCLNGQKLLFCGVKQQTTASGLSQELRMYQATDCQGCVMKSRCTKSAGNRSIQVNRRLEAWRLQCEARITSEHGIKLRINRSIQAEGAFASIKDQRGFRRFRHFGMKKVTAEILWEALGHNLMKLCKKRAQGRLRQHLHEVKEIAS